MSRKAGTPNKPKEQSIDCYKAVATITTNILPIEENTQPKSLYGDKKYRLLVGFSKADLTEQVCIFLDTGFDCQGGVSVTSWLGINGMEFLYCQAMVRRD